jgi:hypothetical protein
MAVFAGCALIRSGCGGVSEFHFGPFLPVVFGAPRANGHAPSRQNERRGITHSPPWATSGAQRRAARNEAKRSGGSLGKPEWRRDGACRPSGRQVKRCPNLLAVSLVEQHCFSRSSCSNGRSPAIDSRRVLSRSGHAVLLLCRELVQIPQSVFDALDSPNRVRRRSGSRNTWLFREQKVRNALVLLEQSESAALPSAQDLEAPEEPRGCIV